MSKNKIIIRGRILEINGNKANENSLQTLDKISMEIHDAVDYLTLKYITKGSKIQALPVKLVTALSREEIRIKEEKIL